MASTPQKRSLVEKADQKRAGMRASAQWRKRIGQAVKRARTAKDLSQSDLGNLVGVDWTSIGRIERGRSVPELSTIEAIADRLGLSIDDLIGRDALPPTRGGASGLRARPPWGNPWPQIAAMQEQIDYVRAALRKVHPEALVEAGGSPPAPVQPKRNRSGDRTA